jgi:hypothetical protein
MKQIALVVCLLTACGSGISGEEAGLHCSAWCDLETGCETGGTPASCLQDCRYNLARTCGEYVAAYQDCVRAQECNSQHSDCQVHTDAHGDCATAVAETCAACPEGTVEGDCSAGALPCFGCYDTGGDCNATNAEGDCRRAVDASQCNDYPACVENEGTCPPEARP